MTDSLWLEGQGKRTNSRWAEVIEKNSAPKVDAETAVRTIAMQAGVTITYESA